jgi:hypothetical protein
MNGIRARNLTLLVKAGQFLLLWFSLLAGIGADLAQRLLHIDLVRNSCGFLLQPGCTAPKWSGNSLYSLAPR